jgi:hypothetical protein
VASSPLFVLTQVLQEVFLFYKEWPTGIAVSKSGRRFANFPKLNPSQVSYTVGELLGDAKSGYKVVPYPNAEINSPPGGPVNKKTIPPTGQPYQDYLISVQNVYVDQKDRLWLIDTGRPTYNNTLIGSAYGGPKLIGIDLTTNQIFSKIVFQPDVVFSDSVRRTLRGRKIGTHKTFWQYIDDMRFDLRPSMTSSGKGLAYISDSSTTGKNAIIVVDLGTGYASRHLQGIPEGE